LPTSAALSRRPHASHEARKPARSTVAGVHEMNKSAESRSGLPLLLVYTLLVIAGMSVAIGSYLTMARLAPAYGDIVFVVLLLGAIIGTWPIAAWIEDRIATRNSGVAIPVAVKIRKT
jgi:hypothetical protein